MLCSRSITKIHAEGVTPALSMFTQTLRSAAIRGTALTARPRFVPRPTAPFTRYLSSSRAARAAEKHDDHDSHFDEPGGWLFGVPPGEKYEPEGWEFDWFYVFYPSLIIAGIVYSMKEDTS